MLAKKTSKNQLTLPLAIAKEFPDVDYFDIALKSGKIILTPVVMRPVDSNLMDIREKIEKLGITGNDVREAVKWARKQGK